MDSKETYEALGLQPYAATKRPSLVATPAEINTLQTKNFPVTFHDEL